LGALVAIDATLRLVPSFLGASPIFALIVLVGYVFGPRFGFVMGALTLLLSATITAGIGPWLPFQMLCAGWIGLGAGWLPHRIPARAKVVGATAFGAAAGFGYGALMNLYSWPFVAPGAASDAGLYWSPTLSFGESIERYMTFYLATSFVHDASRAAATALLIVVAGGPVLRMLQRFRTRAVWTSASSQ
jgi:energy-coupling factor transport system substrate-specific component